MPDQFSTFADAPVELAAVDGQPARSRIHVAQLGRFSDRRYGQFSITQREVDNWKRLLAEHFHGRVPIDTDHATDKGVSSEASGWIVGLHQHGTDVLADVEWTPKGEAAIRERRYLYISPTFTSDLKDDRGKSLGPALLRAAQTNAPFLHRMPAVSLSGATLAERIADAPDSRPAMPDLKNIALALELPEDADEAKILEAVADAKAEPEAPDTKTLEAQAAEQGKVLLDATEVAKLSADAAQGVAAAEQLRAQRFDTAFSKALDAGRVDAKPETRERFEGLYKADADLTIQTLDALPALVNTTARGEGGDTTAVPDGVDADSYKLDLAVQAHMTEHNVDYMTALDAVSAKAGV